MKAELPDTVDRIADSLPFGTNTGVEEPSGDTGGERLVLAEPTASFCDKDKPNGSNIVGRLNNLVTTDIQTITRGRDWLLPGAAPLSLPSFPST